MLTTLISLITFPGVIAHEWSHKKFCNWTGVKVLKVRYFRFGDPAGYVEHEMPSTFKQTFWISIGPLILNSLLTLVLSFIAFKFAHDQRWFFGLLWLAFSIGMYAFPSNHDMSNISDIIKLRISILYYLALPLIWLVWLANKLRFFWFDAIYSVALIVLVYYFLNFYLN